MFFTPVPEGVRHLSIHRHREQRHTSLKGLVCNTVVQKGTERKKKKKRASCVLTLKHDAPCATVSAEGFVPLHALQSRTNVSKRTLPGVQGVVALAFLPKVLNFDQVELFLSSSIR